MIIPARAGSKRIPDKNLQLLDGMSLVEHAVASGKEVTDEVFISTDSPKDYKAFACIKRPKKFCKDTSDIGEAIKHACQGLDVRDQVITLQPTCPIRPIGFMGKMLQIKRWMGARSALTVVPAAYQVLPGIPVSAPDSCPQPKE